MIERLEDVGEGVLAQLNTGETIEADWVLAGIGVIPNIDLAREAGLDTDTGVLVDSHLRASAPDVYAVGDIAQYDSVLHHKRLRIEHWDVARQQGTYVGHQIAGVGRDDPYRVTPYFFSQLGDWMYMRYVGPGMGDVTVRGDMDGDSFSAVYVRDGHLVACLAVDHDEDLDAARAMLGAPIEEFRVHDPAQPLNAHAVGL
jgi:3-phenylpropionate/trans-cinnamate dioxygenase ferredoxin reductase subunit